jgi:hypothetical protein
MSVNRYCLDIVSTPPHWSAVIDRLSRTLEVIIVDEGGKPALYAGEPAILGVVEAVDAHFQCLEPFLDLVTIGVLTVTAVR